MQKIKVPRRLFLDQKILSVPENAFKANLSITVACLMFNPQTYWLIFKSEESDFITMVYIYDGIYISKLNSNFIILI